MKQFGYLPQGDNESDFIFSADTLSSKIKLVQKFGRIPQTGEIDEATIEVSFFISILEILL